jgi:O-antigen/teichoic acid export membrane protein
VLFSNALSAIVLWRAMPRVPRLRFDWGEFRSLASFGGSMSIELLLWQGTTRLFALQVGYFHGVAALGYFQFAQRVVEEAGNLIQANVVRFGLSFFADLDRSDRNANRAFLTGTSLVTVAGGVLFIGVALVAGDLVPLVFGPAWQPAGALMQIFAAASFFPLSRALAGPLLRAKGHQNAMVVYGLVACLITLASGFVTADQALVVVVLGWGARNLVSLPWSYIMVSRYGRVPVRDQLVSAVRPLAPMAAMTVTVLLTQHLLADAPAALRLVSAILVGLITVAITVPLFNWRMISELRQRVGRLRGGGAGA